jgi:adenylate cyclase
MVLFEFLRFYHEGDADISAMLPEISLDFKYMVWLGVQSGLILGTVYGLVDVFLDQHWLRKKSYSTVLVIKAMIHFLIILSLSIFLRIEAFDKMDIELTPEQLGTSLANPGVLIIFLYTTLVNFLINFTRQITLKFGPGNLTKFLTGKFHQPKEELRIFMFVDMTASTTHAERLGHVEFGGLIQDCFSDLTVIENRQAEVYQYVGDEAIIYWEVDKGLRNLNCLMAYFDFKQRLANRSDYYLGKYGVQPEFKAGMNIGPVTVTEIGDIKRDLAFLGDTMNTAARIQSLCGQYQEELLISDALMSQLPKSNSLELELVDNLAPKGKQQSIEIYAARLTEATQL